MDRRTRKDLKKDSFREGVGHSFEFLAEHGPAVKKYSALAALVLVAGIGWWIYSGRQAAARAEALADAMHVADAVISDTPQPPNLNFSTQDEKDAAVQAAYQEVVDGYKGSQEAAIAQLFLAAAQADKGEVEAAADLYRDMIDWAPKDYASVATVSLAEVYAGQDRLPEAETLLRGLIDNPSVFVSSEEAGLTLGMLLTQDEPEKARELLEPLRGSRTAISRAAIDALGRMPPSDTPQPSTPVESN